MIGLFVVFFPARKAIDDDDDDDDDNRSITSIYEYSIIDIVFEIYLISLMVEY